MKFINKTKNSVQLEDVNLSIPYNDGLPQELDTQTIKKSFAFQQIVAMGGFEVIEASSDRLETNLLRISRSIEQPVDKVVERLPSGEKIEVILRGHFYEYTGYAKVNRNFSMSLAIDNIFVEISPISIRNSDINEVEARMLSLLKRQVGKDAILIDSVVPTHAKPSSKLYNILYTTAETNRVPKQFIDVTELYDEVWVTSTFSKQSYEESGCKKRILIVPPIINGNLYSEKGASYVFRPSIKKFVFTSVMTWGYRKGSDALVRAFCSQFTGDDDVSLVLLISEKSKEKQLSIKKEIDKIRSEFVFPPDIRCCMKGIPEYQMPSFYRACNVFVLPSRGEGFGIPYCEASLCGLPVISTKYGGQLDFLSNDNSYLVDIDGLEVAEKGKTGVHFWDGYSFPRLKSDDFIERLGESMRYVYSNYEEAKQKNIVLQSKIRQNFLGETISKIVKPRLEEIWKSRSGK